ncbi:MAG: efflux RND transporter periplasmic adaptor subunit [Candidatus Omnitrophica bacterium]|nr:efflux RND transporter periplasmic adaptor subunit [Candidatus Omnitrophota bacterium]
MIQPPDPPQKNPMEKLTIILAKLLIFFKELGAKVLQKYPIVMQKIEKFSEEKIEPKLPAKAKDVVAKNRRILIWAVALFILFVLFRGCLGGDRPSLSLEDTVSRQTEAKDAPVAIKGFKVGRFNYEDSLRELGTIKGALEFKLSFEIPGVISSINYREGERYEEGALLVSLRQDDILLRLKRAQAEHNKFETQAKINEEKVNEHEKLLAMGAIPKSTLDKVKLEHDSSKYEAEAAKLEMKANEAMLEKSNLYAPSAGMIGELYVEEGETVTPNTLLGSHVMTEYVYAEFGVVERDVNKIALGQKARVFVDAYQDKTFEGVIENVSPVVTGTSRTATVKVRVENPDRLLLPGMFARVSILLYNKKNALVVPTDALQGPQGEQFIYAIDSEKNVAVKRPVTVGYTREDYSQIDAGLSDGEVVAVSGIERLEDGKKIRLQEIEEAEI